MSTTVLIPNALAVEPARITIAKRFLVRAVNPFPVDPEDCWEWGSAVSGNGYGYFWLQGRSIGAHRASYILFRGVLVPGDCIDHLCMNTVCVNPGHLEVVTRGENTARGNRMRVEPEDVWESAVGGVIW